MRVGIVGCGQVSRIHVPYLLRNKSARIVGICDVDENKAKAAAREFGIAKHYSQPATLFSQEKPDVVHILTPPHTHAALAIEAMEAGCHVLVEKPMALCVQEADRMIAVARQTGKKLCVDHDRLFHPAVLRAKRYLETGHLGQLIGIESFQGFALPNFEDPHSAKWQSHWLSQLPLGAIHDIGPHPLALLLDFVAVPRTFHVVVKKTGDSGLAPCEEVRVLAEGEKSLGSCTISLGIRPFMNVLTLYGSAMSLQINLDNVTIIQKKERRLPAILRKGLPNIEEAFQLFLNTAINAGRHLMGKLDPHPGIAEVIRRFYESLETGTSPPVSMEQGREVVRLLDVIAEASGKNSLCVSS